jgi:hypothetical protein
VLFRHSVRAGQAAGMPANIHSDGITPVMYSILALELSNPQKNAAGMWLPSCFIDGDVSSCGLFPRPFIPDPSPSERRLQEQVVHRFLLLGRCIGIALRDRRVFMLPLSLAFADALCGKQLSIWDTCIGDIELQENDGFSASSAVLHAVEHRLDFLTSFSMVYRGRDLSDQRVDVPVSASSFSSPAQCFMRDVSVLMTFEESGSVLVDVKKDVFDYVHQHRQNGDLVYVMFSGRLPPSFSCCRAYSVCPSSPAADSAAPRLKVCLDALVSSSQCVKAHAHHVNMHIMRVFSSTDGAGVDYLKALEVPCFQYRPFPIDSLQAYCLCSGIQMQIDAARRGLQEFVPLQHLEVVLFAVCSFFVHCCTRLCLKHAQRSTGALWRWAARSSRCDDRRSARNKRFRMARLCK